MGIRPYAGTHISGDLGISRTVAIASIVDIEGDPGESDNATYAESRCIILTHAATGARTSLRRIGIDDGGRMLPAFNIAGRYPG